MPVLHIPTPLRSYTNGQTDISIHGSTVAEAMEDLICQFPVLQPHLYSSQGILRPFVNLFLGEKNIKDLQGMQTPLQESERIMLVPSIAGG